MSKSGGGGVRSLGFPSSWAATPLGVRPPVYTGLLQAGMSGGRARHVQGDIGQRGEQLIQTQD